ncbi:MAG: carbon storage regulator [Planctomycetota bacterium]|nr:MAG: carbon storage regulator [Planctomycetota bacterium]
MLVLSRQRDESIMIGDNIVVTIIDIRGDKVRLGINAPSEIPVHRQEVYEAIQRENLRASRLEPGDTQDIGKLGSRGGHNGSTGPNRPVDGPRR